MINASKSVKSTQSIEYEANSSYFMPNVDDYDAKPMGFCVKPDECEANSFGFGSNVNGYGANPIDFGAKPIAFIAKSSGFVANSFGFANKTNGFGLIIMYIFII